MGVVEEASAELIRLLGAGGQIRPFSRRGAGFDLSTAYEVAERVRELRRNRGERTVGRKIGFTNREIWRSLGISSPIWNYMFDSTVRYVEGGAAELSLGGLPEPRVEPEIVLHLAAAPASGMALPDLMECIDWIAPGFELVYSVYPGWDFTAADAVAAYGVHAALVVGEVRDVRSARRRYADRIAACSVELRSASGEGRRGDARDVLGGPLESLKFLVDTVAANPAREPIRAGELVTTGTLTEAMPARAGESWTARFHGIDLASLQLRLT